MRISGPWIVRSEGGRSQPQHWPRDGESGSGACERTAAVPMGFVKHGGENGVAEAVAEGAFVPGERRPVFPVRPGEARGGRAVGTGHPGARPGA